MPNEIEQIQTQLAVNGNAYIKARRRTGESLNDAVKKLYQRLWKYRKAHGLTAWEFYVGRGGVFVNVKKEVK